MYIVRRIIALFWILYTVGLSMVISSLFHLQWGYFIGFSIFTGLIFALLRYMYTDNRHVYFRNLAISAGAAILIMLPSAEALIGPCLIASVIPFIVAFLCKKRIKLGAICSGICLLMMLIDALAYGIENVGLFTIPVFVIVILVEAVILIVKAVKERKNAKENPSVTGNDESRTIAVDGVEAAYAGTQDGVKIYKAENADKEKQDKLIAETNFQVGMACYNAEGTEKNIDEALKYLELAADAGHTAAQYNLGIIYLVGKETAKNAEKGAKYMKLAADNGFTEAQYNYAVALRRGDGVQQDLLSAKLYLEMAAAKGSVNAMMEMSRAYINGEYNMMPDYQKAEEWAKRAIENGAGEVGQELLNAIRSFN